MAYTTIDDPEKYYQSVTWTGNSDSTRNIVLPGDTDMQPDIVWADNISNTSDNRWSTSILGTSQHMIVNGPDAVDGSSTALTAFNSDGFSTGNEQTYNNNGNSHIAWCWKEDPIAGLDLVPTYEGNATARTISHNLGAVPHWMLIRNIDQNRNWVVYHHKNTSAPETDYLYLSSTEATADANTIFNDTAPTSSVFTVGTDNGVNDNGQTHIAHLWTGIKGFSKFGSYTGNGNADGAFIFTGFQPQTVIIKITSEAEDWQLFDQKLGGYNGGNLRIAPSANSGASSGDNRMDLVSNGFKLRDAGTNFNKASATYVYMAWARSPFVNSNGVPCNAR